MRTSRKLWRPAGNESEKRICANATMSDQAARKVYLASRVLYKTSKREVRVLGPSPHTRVTLSKSTLFGPYVHLGPVAKVRKDPSQVPRPSCDSELGNLTSETLVQNKLSKPVSRVTKL